MPPTAHRRRRRYFTVRMRSLYQRFATTLHAREASSSTVVDGRTATLHGLVRECTRRQKEPGGLAGRRVGATDDEDKVDETYAPERSLREDDTAETNTARKTIMITSGRHSWFIGNASFGTNSSAFGRTDGRRSGTVCPHFTFVLRFDRAARDSPLRVEHVASHRCLRLATTPHRHSLTMRSSRRRRRRRTQTNDAAGNQSLCDAILASSVPAAVCLPDCRLLPLLHPAHCYVFGDILLETAT